VAFVSIPGKVRQKSDGRGILINDPSSILALRLEDVLKEHASGRLVVTSGNIGFALNRLEDKIRRIDLTVRMRIGNTYHIAFVLEDENVFHFPAGAKIDVLVTPGLEKDLDFSDLQFSQRHVVFRTVADHAGDAGRRPIAVDAWRSVQMEWRLQS